MLHVTDETELRAYTGKKRGPKPKPKPPKGPPKKRGPKPKPKIPKPPKIIKTPPPKRLPREQPNYPLESEEQVSLFKWLLVMTAKYPCLELAFHIPNGGSRNLLEACHLRDQGLKPGVPDIFIPVPRGKFHGLWIEMKRRGKGTHVTFDQDLWIKRLCQQGYVAGVCYGWEAAARIIIQYLHIKPIESKGEETNGKQTTTDNKGNADTVREMPSSAVPEGAKDS